VSIAGGGHRAPVLPQTSVRHPALVAGASGHDRSPQCRRMCQIARSTTFGTPLVHDLPSRWPAMYASTASLASLSPTPVCSSHRSLAAHL
jgi:hypothetical protein